MKASAQQVLHTGLQTFRIDLTGAGKRFNRDWIFRGMHYTFTSGNAYAVTGPNGSGKSTLLQCIAAAIQSNEGTIEYRLNDTVISHEEVFKHVAIVAPYLEVIEEMTATEFLAFHASFKPLLAAVSIPQIIAEIGLAAAAHKQIRFYSSGMKQRVKMAQAIFSAVPVLLLDEPCTNLDLSGYELYHALIAKYCGDKLIIVSSNDKNEYNFCKEVISIADYKNPVNTTV
ncbi:ATP-binding cassette domain-containing protein [Panacibacter sp. DH6]|uniref:ATP-binding cassette domain-containing protein n=1 Tax=Panacibacter microcysteis TaxID=2793269 RepID=A0A931E7C9_9BACT|nr:ATP-binding cassette domain-containing protein [Panacibacter microcysteis]MBG9376519.1 ATP-binding cassette domain-containing protein [Panacibacter microcysteis]